jgi:hypothetical protein
MRNLKVEFSKSTRHFDAYLNLVGAPLHNALAHMQEVLIRDDIATSVDTTYVNNYPALRVSAFTVNNTASVFVAFDALNAPYAIGIESGYGLNHFQLAHNTADAASLIASKLKSQIQSWQ